MSPLETIECINIHEYERYGGYKLMNMAPGNYTARLRAITLAGSGPRTETKIFQVPDIKVGKNFKVLWILLLQYEYLSYHSFSKITMLLVRGKTMKRKETCCGKIWTREWISVFDPYSVESCNSFRKKPQAQKGGDSQFRNCCSILSDTDYTITRQWLLHKKVIRGNQDFLSPQCNAMHLTGTHGGGIAPLECFGAKSANYSYCAIIAW